MAGTIPQTVTKEALAFYNAAEETMSYLAGRWQDEAKYEDIRDYMKPLQPIAKRTGVLLVQMTGRPFGVKFSVGDKTFWARIKGRSYEYVRIK